MKIFLSLILLLFSISSFAKCEFKSGIKKVVSLSGTTTVLFKELKLLDFLYGVSVFNPITEKEFKGKVFPGGIFLSQNSFSEIKDATVFFDESRDLRKMLQSNNIKAEEIRSRNQGPYETVETTLGLLKKNYLQHCDVEIQRVLSKTKELQSNILRHMSSLPTVVFYLGGFRNGRPPELVMVNDGVVKWLLQEKKLKTYPSELSYVNWSARIINDLPKNTLHVAIQDSSREDRREFQKNDHQITLIYPGSLVPGISQLEAFLFLFEKI